MGSTVAVTVAAKAPSQAENAPEEPSSGSSFSQKWWVRWANTDRVSILIAQKKAVNSLASLIVRIDINDVPASGGLQRKLPGVQTAY